MGAGGWIFLITGILMCFIFAPIVIDAKKSREIAEEWNGKYENARKNWDTRAKQLGFSSSGKSIVYKKYSNTDNFYPVYVWVENGLLYEFIAEPTKETCGASTYNYQENINKAIFGNIRRIYRTGSQGQYIETDSSHVDGLTSMANISTGLTRLHYLIEAADATQYAPTRTVKYDTRLTIVEANGRNIEFRIDAYEVFKRLVPNVC